jgi:hypothetical protein
MVKKRGGGVDACDPYDDVAEQRMNPGYRFSERMRGAKERANLTETNDGDWMALQPGADDRRKWNRGEQSVKRPMN